MTCRKILASYTTKQPIQLNGASKQHYVTTLYLFYKITPLDQGCLLTTVKLKVKKKNEIKNNENKYLSNSTLIIRKQGK